MDLSTYVMVSCSLNIVLITSLDSNKTQHINIPKGVRKFKNKIQRSEESIFNKAKGFKWGCGRKCDKERQLLNVFKEKSKVADQKIIINNKKKINKLLKGRR